MTEEERKIEVQKYGEMFVKLKEIRKSLKDPVTRDDQMGAEQAAIELFKSDEFGNFVSMSTLFRLQT
jgi:hypothetical protein